MATLLGEDILGVEILGEEIEGEDMLGEDILGEDILGEDMLGVDWKQVAAMSAGGPAGAAAYAAYRRRQAQKRAAKLAQKGAMLIRKNPPLINKVPGVSAPAQVKIPLGFGAVSFAAGSLATGGQVTGTATATPQVPVRGGRLVLNRFDTPVTAGVGTSACSILITNILVGQQSVFASAQGVPVEAFGPTATDSVLSIPAAQPGVIITAYYTLANNTGSALAATASATVSGALICDSIAG